MKVHCEFSQFPEKGRGKNETVDIDIDRFYCHSDIQVYRMKFRCMAPMV